MSVVTYDPSERIWKGPQINSIYNPNAGLGEIILSELAKTPNKVCQINHDENSFSTCKEIREKSILAAENLKRMGYNYGDTIAMVCKNTPNVAPIVYGCFIIGAPVHCLDPTFKSDDLNHMFDLTKPKLIFCEKFNLDTVIHASHLSKLDKSNIIILEKLTDDQSNYANNLFRDVPKINTEHYIPPVLLKPDQHPAVILCSSGTTGPPKAVCLSHSNLIAQITSHWVAYHDDVFVCFTTLYWISCVVSLIHGTVSGMIRVITSEPFSPDLLCQMIEKYKVTTVMAPPLNISKLLSKLDGCSKKELPDFSSVRLFLAGGAFVSDDLRLRLQKYLKCVHVAIGLGMTEMGGLCFIGEPNTKLGAVGPLRPMMQAKIIDDFGKRLQHNEHGEVCYKYPYTFLKYLGNKKATENTIDKEGWVKSGDIGYFDLDNQFHIIDRKKDIIKHMMYHIYPAEIETFLQKETGISEVCVVGVDDIEDYPAALIVKPKESSITPRDIIELVERSLPVYKHLTGGCYFIDKLPLTPSGKLQRRVARAYATELYRKS